MNFIPFAQYISQVLFHINTGKKEIFFSPLKKRKIFGLDSDRMPAFFGSILRIENYSLYAIRSRNIYQNITE